MKNKTNFIRVEKDNNYSVIHNQFLRREDLSWKAKGILAYILMLPDDWNINLKEVMRHATEGEKAFRSGWKELKDAGYVKRYPVRNEETKKIAYWETVVREKTDLTTTSPHTQNLHVDKVDVDKVDVGNGNLLSTDRTKYLNKQSTDNTNKKSSRNSGKPKYDDDSPYMKLAEHLQNYLKHRNPEQKEPNWQTWADDLRKTIELDKRPIKNVKDVIDWSQNNDFWQNNIMSPAKLRKQYDTMKLQMNNQKSKPNQEESVGYGGLDF